MLKAYLRLFLGLLIIFILCVIYGMLIFFILLNGLELFTPAHIDRTAFSLSSVFNTGLQQGWIYALVLYVSVLFLAISCIKKGEKITLGRIVNYVYWFFIMTTAIFIFNVIDLLTNNFGFFMRYPLYFAGEIGSIAFPITWLVFFFIYRAITVNRT
ncbi:MAG TPA: hypothetical protein VK483_09065 [Chitinophagaceae bacterium]|nr:hypothetical protein [Chitinophagaceae bacterium]